MKQHVIAFLIALAVWVVGNAVIGGYRASAQGSAPTGITSILPHDCNNRVDQYVIDHCGRLPFCDGFCSRFDYYTSRCEVDLGGLICDEQWLPTVYKYYRTNCTTSGLGCVCNSSWKWVTNGLTYYYKCL